MECFAGDEHGQLVLLQVEVQRGHLKVGRQLSHQYEEDVLSARKIHFKVQPGYHEMGRQQGGKHVPNVPWLFYARI